MSKDKSFWLLAGTLAAGLIYEAGCTIAEYIDNRREVKARIEAERAYMETYMRENNERIDRQLEMIQRELDKNLKTLAQLERVGVTFEDADI